MYKENQGENFHGQRSKLNIELSKKLARCYVWSIDLYLRFRDLDTKKIVASKCGARDRIEKIKWPKKVNNEKVLENIEKSSKH